MPMTIGEVRLVRDDGTVDASGRKRTQEFEVDYGGPYDAGEANALAIFTPIGLDEVDVTIGSAIPGTSINVRRRRAELIDLDFGGTGTFKITVEYEEGFDFAENPLLRKDDLQIRRSAATKELVRDANGLVFGTYRLEGTTPKLIEIFQSGPTIQVGRYSIVVSGYRENYRLAQPEYDADGDGITDPINPEKGEDFAVVNSDAVEFGELTFPPGTVCLLQALATPVTINGYSVIRHEWQFDVQPTWNVKVKNAGLYEYDSAQPSGQEQRRMWDPVQNTSRTVPWPIGTDGKALPKGDQPVYLNFKTTRPLDFTSYFSFSFPA